MALIELGEERYDPPPDPAPSRRSRRRRLRTPALVLVAALVAGTGGAAPPGVPQLAEVYRVGNTGYFLLAGDRLFVAEPLTGGHRVSAYEVGRRRQVWNETYRTEHQQATLVEEDGLLLLVEGGVQNGPYRSTALDPGTGRTRWSTSSQFAPLHRAGIALVVEEVFPPGSRVDPDDPPPVGTPIHHPRWGAGMYTAAPIGQTVRVLDLDTGRELWTSPLLTGVAAVPAVAGRPAALLTGRPDGRLDLRDPRTGAVRQPLDPVGGPPLYAEPAGDSVLVRSDSHLAVYSADRWQRRWIRALSTDRGQVGACGSMLCLEGRAGVEVIDPVTGGTAWHDAGQVSLRGHGGHLVEVGGNGAVRRAVDPRSGRTVVDLTGWTRVPTLTEAEPMLLLRHAVDGSRTWVGLLDPEGTAIRPLGPLPYALSSCRWTARLLACRTGDGVIRVWRYAPGSAARR
ncbi:PQQ-binding-like beta-propeller repeat protein [Plantactinospora sp. BB1]|uniref:outer membrane protein assembly factor BamB family protein n=1 Tax=Plantactinospora sp. BB1 TaxID=2071627 RepID=UPI000D164DB2|nr:PQQ-binding-like beta-propeller repeat protein [Plantactinospora sp. BB1]AVT39650.1 hypothetical protein C6W10_28040 [Plantactinospora sp. BB1]